MDQLVLNYHVDPGHGWLEVPLADFLNAGAVLADVSGYSYCAQSNFGVILYLEEDCDMTLFMDAASARGIPVKVSHVLHNADCFVRQLSGIPETV